MRKTKSNARQAKTGTPPAESFAFDMPKWAHRQLESMAKAQGVPLDAFIGQVLKDCVASAAGFKPRVITITLRGKDALEIRSAGKKSGLSALAICTAGASILANQIAAGDLADADFKAAVLEAARGNGVAV